MNHVMGIALCFAGLSALAQVEDVDPVVRAKERRAVRDSQDLPPIPRGLTEPPPLPPPELHTHDIRRRRGGARAAKRPAAQKGARPQAQQARAAQPKAQAPAKKRQAGQARKT
jgi:hypothetical protein